MGGQSMWMQGSNSDLFTRENKSQVWPNSTGLSISPDNVSNTIYNTINSPINQISFGISNLLTQEKPQYKTAPVRQISYSSIAKKEIMFLRSHSFLSQALIKSTLPRNNPLLPIR